MSIPSIRLENDLHYNIAKSEADKFQNALDAWNPIPPDGVDPIIHAAQRSAIESQLNELQRAVDEYEKLTGKRSTTHGGSAMYELRWVVVDEEGGDLQLQFRTRGMQTDASGAVCGFSDWSDWVAVPIVHGKRHAVSVVDVFVSDGLVRN